MSCSCFILFALREDGGHNCVGPDKSYRSCNIQDCPEGSRDFREEQCSQFDGTDFHGKRYKWLPYYGAENPCELNCMPRGENFFYRHRRAVIDGTPCHPGRTDICVDGVCRRMGCDNMLESPQQEDPCLQCGGNGQSCYRVKNSFTARDLPTGYNQMFIIPVGATTISIRETHATRNYLAIKNLRGEYYLNGHWVIEFSRATPIGGTMLYYQRGAEGDSVPETIIGRGPTTEPLVVELISQEPNQGVEYEYYLPNGRSREGYYWSYGSWSACSKECGSGYQSRLVFCSIDNEAYPDYLCASLPRPQSNRTCNPQPCPQIRSWQTGEWNACSVTCGGGSQVRSVQCVSNDVSGPRVVEDAICAAYADAPPPLQTCNMQKCAEYHVTGWSACSVTCGSGQQTREVTCMGSDGTRLDETSCSALLRPAAVQRCEMAPCPQQISWHVGDWGLCSKSCGSGSRERQVICSDQERNLYPVDQCNTQPKPLTVERCNTQPCYSPQGEQMLTKQINNAPVFILFLKLTRRPETRDPTQTNTVYDPHSSAPALHCSQSYYGCCSDGHTSARGPQGLGCPSAPAPSPVPTSCIQTRYPPALCYYGVTAAQGPNKEGCAAYVNPSNSLKNEKILPYFMLECRTTTYGCCYDRTTPAGGPNGEGCPNPPNYIERSICSLPRAAGSCSSWVSRYHFDVISSKCVHFWYGGCHGNSNNFMTLAECKRTCPRPAPSRQAPQPAAPSGESTRTAAGEHSTTGAETSSLPAGTPAFTWHSCTAHRPSCEVRPQRPRESSEKLTLPDPTPLLPLLASLTLGGVTIDKTDPSTVEALVGQTVVLPCRVSPPPSSTVVVEWRRDGIPLSTHRHHQQPNGSLLVGPVSKLDSGWFLCVATRERERDHRYIYLAVSADLKITTAPNNIQVSEGSTGMLPCVVSGDNVNIGWSRNGVPVRPDGRNILLSSDGSLILNNVKPSDQGTYTCNAYTGIYSVSATAEVKVIKETQQGADLPPECLDQPELANCELIVYARLCSNSYYSSFCCASCTRHSQKKRQVWSTRLKPQRV
uniref:Papilin a, proteoglycan-like sulfated glycoprotein n=1 Tax=Astatotilapia calliptera TaxID=8154 RepID=A0AAX7TJ55_ASTCA